MCKCIDEVEERFKKHYNADEANVLSAHMYTKDSGIQLQTVSTISIKIAGEKKVKKVDATHSYCPFCGEKYKELSD